MASNFMDRSVRIRNSAHWFHETVTCSFAAAEEFKAYVSSIPTFLMEFVPTEYASPEEYANARAMIDLDKEQELVVRLGAGYIPPRGALIEWGNCRSVNTLLAIESLQFINNFVEDSDSDDEDSSSVTDIVFHHQSGMDESIQCEMQSPELSLCEFPVKGELLSLIDVEQCEINSPVLETHSIAEEEMCEFLAKGELRSSIDVEQCEICSPVLETHSIAEEETCPINYHNVVTELCQCETSSPDLETSGFYANQHGADIVPLHQSGMDENIQCEMQSPGLSLCEFPTKGELLSSIEVEQCEIHSPVLETHSIAEGETSPNSNQDAVTEFCQCETWSPDLEISGSYVNQHSLGFISIEEVDSAEQCETGYPVLDDCLYRGSDHCNMTSFDMVLSSSQLSIIHDFAKEFDLYETSSCKYEAASLVIEQCEMKSPILEFVPVIISAYPLKVYPSASTEALFMELASLAITSEVQQQILTQSELVDNFLSLPVDLFLETPVVELASLFVVMVEPYTKEFLGYNPEALSFYLIVRELLHELLAKLNHENFHSIVDLVLHILLVVRNFPPSAQQGVFFQLLGHVAARIFVCINPISLACIWDHSYAAILQINRIIEQSPHQVREGDTLGCFAPFVRLTSELTRLIFRKGERLADTLRDNSELLLSNSGMHEWDWLRTSMVSMWEFIFLAWNSQELQVFMDPLLWGLPNFLFGHTELVFWQSSQYNTLDFTTFPSVSRNAILEHERKAEWNIDCQTIANLLETPGSAPPQQNLCLQAKQGFVNDKLAQHINLTCQTDKESVEVYSRVKTVEPLNLLTTAVYLKEVDGTIKQHTLSFQMKRNGSRQGPTQDSAPICPSGNWSSTQEGAKFHVGSPIKEPPDVRELVDAQTGNGLCHDDSKNKFSFRFLVIAPEMILSNQHLFGFTLRHAFKLALGPEEHVFKSGSFSYVNIENTDISLCFVPGGFLSAVNLMEFFPHQIPQTIDNLYFSGFGRVEKFKQTPYASVIAEGVIKLNISDVYEYTIPKLHQECGSPLMTCISGNWFILGLHFSSEESYTKSFTSCISSSKLCLNVLRLCQFPGRIHALEGRTLCA